MRHVEPLQTSPNARDRTVVVGTLLVDDALVKSPLPFVVVVGNVGHEVGVSAIALAHNAIFIIAKFSCAQPQCVMILIGVASVLKRRSPCLFDGATYHREMIREKYWSKHHLKSAEGLDPAPVATQATANSLNSLEVSWIPCSL